MAPSPPRFDFENIRCEVKGALALVAVDRPQALNALNIAALRELDECFKAIRDNAEVRVAIITGAGEKAFVAGADIGELAAVRPLEALDFARRGQQVFDLIENLGKPVIACVNGFALGGGCELAMACTLRLASENAKFGQPEVKLGIIPGYGGTQRLPRLAGKGTAMRLLLTGDIISAAEAHRIGLVDEVVPQAQLLSTAEAIAQKIIANGPLAVRFCMEAVNRGADMSLAEGVSLEAGLFALAFASEDKAEGTRAFLEKRPPRFTGK